MPTDTTTPATVFENVASKKAKKTTYFQTVVNLITSPRIFFTELPQDISYKQSLGFLIISGLFWSSLRYTYYSDHSLFEAATLLINSFGMPFVLAGFTFMIMGLFFGRVTTFKRIAIIYIYATGVTMLVSWLPTVEIFTEPWRFILVAVGLVKSCSFKWTQAVTAIVLGVFIMLALLASLNPVLYQLKVIFG
ncbi:MAG: YIP1 family protein [Desulfoplanes sp.]|nr:YIP1 family protein [Desulfoplanes sp.]